MLLPRILMDGEMEEAEDEDNGSGVGAFLAPLRKKVVKKALLQKAPAKNASVKTGDSVLGVCQSGCARCA